jgi:hypothetical protein
MQIPRRWRSSEWQGFGLLFAPHIRALSRRGLSPALSHKTRKNRHQLRDDGGGMGACGAALRPTAEGGCRHVGRGKTRTAPSDKWKGSARVT